ncbi:MAG: MATE family efflux transporter [Clostridia bacterium]|nr:MATE family efflux transporter [Clostridia bacterium]
MYSNTSKEVFKMSVPIFFELLLQLLVGNIDQIMVSRYSQGSVAAINNGNQIMNIIIIVLNCMSVATTILITRAFGAGDRKQAKVVSNVSVYLLAGFSIVVTAIIFVFSRAIFRALSIPDEILDETSKYTVIVAGFVLIQAVYMVVAAILRSYNLMKEITVVAIIMNGINILGNAILIRFYGIIGAAISTDFSKLIGLVLIVMVLLKKTDMDLSFLRLKYFSKNMAKRLMVIAIPSGGEALSYQLSQMYILRFVNTFGVAVIASRGYCNMLANVAYVYSMAIAQATQILVGYLYGKNDYKSIGIRVRNSCLISMAVSVSVTILLLINSDIVVGLFTNEQFILDLCHKILFVEIVLEIGRSINITMVKCLVATGDVNVPVVFCVFSAWIVAVGLSYVLGIKMGYGLAGIWCAMACDECLRGFAFILRFLQGKWKLAKAN